MRYFYDPGDMVFRRSDDHKVVQVGSMNLATKLSAAFSLEAAYGMEEIQMTDAWYQKAHALLDLPKGFNDYVAESPWCLKASPDDFAAMSENTSALNNIVRAWTQDQEVAGR